MSKMEQSKIEYYDKSVCYRFIKCAREPSLETIVLLGGAFQSVDSWKVTVQHFERFADVLLVDLPGTGTSDEMDASQPIDFQVNALSFTLNYLEIGKVNLIGSSYGSPVAVRFSQKFEERLIKMVLPGAIGKIPDKSKQELKRALVRGSSEEFESGVLSVFMNEQNKRFIKNFDLAARLLQRTLRKASVNEKKHVLNHTDRINDQPIENKKVGIPVLVFTGEFDDFTPINESKFSYLFKNLTIVKIGGSDHLFYLNDVNGVNDLIIDFFMKPSQSQNASNER